MQPWRDDRWFGRCCVSWFSHSENFWQLTAPDPVQLIVPWSHFSISCPFSTSVWPVSLCDVIGPEKKWKIVVWAWAAWNGSMDHCLEGLGNHMAWLEIFKWWLMNVEWLLMSNGGPSWVFQRVWNKEHSKNGCGLLKFLCCWMEIWEKTFFWAHGCQLS